jgi:hypothetical protein
MANTFKPNVRMMWIPAALIAATFSVAPLGEAWARGAAMHAQPVSQTFITSRGRPAFISGHVGSMATTTMPGGGQGFLMNNGNGTSTLTAPGAIPQTVISPR